MTIRQTVQGRWRADVEPIKGKRFRKTFSTKAEAKRFEVAVRLKLAKDNEWSPRVKDRRRLLELIGLWYDVHGHTLRDGDRRRRMLDRLAERLGNSIAATFDPALYAQDRRRRSYEGIANKTLNNELSYLRAVFNELISLQQIRYPNPLQTLKPVKVQEQELSWLTTEQINELLTAIRSRTSPQSNPHLELIVLICLATGARWSEAEGLTANTVRNDAVTFTNTKSGKVRTVPIAAELAKRLHIHWSVHGQFTTSIGAFRRVLERTAIHLPDGQASHVLRHTFASHFIMGGGNILTLQRILGHSSVKVTMRYAHLAPEHLQDAVKYAPVSCFTI
jgi:integrase